MKFFVERSHLAEHWYEILFDSPFEHRIGTKFLFSKLANKPL